MREPTKTWLKAAGIRSLKTFAQTAVAMIITATAMGDVDWMRALSVCGLAAILSIFTSLAGLPEVTASEIKEEESK